jgi:hypothetical protein
MDTSPLTVLTSRERALMFLPRNLPLTLEIVNSRSVEMSLMSTSPETDLASSTFGVDEALIFPLTVSARTAPWTPLILTFPDTDFAETSVDAGTAIV